MKRLLEPGEHPDPLIKEMLEELAEALESFFDDAGVCGASVEPIEHEHRSGFTPYTNGGYNGCANVSFQHAKWGGWTCLQSYFDADEAEMLEAFKEHMKEEGKLEAFGLTEEEWADMTPIQFWRHVRDFLEPDDRQLELDRKVIGQGGYPRDPSEEFESEWTQADDTVFFLMFRAIYYTADNHRSETGEDEVYFFCGVNNDFNYGRDSISWAKGSCWATEWGKTYKVSEITPELLESIKKEMLEHFRNA